MAWVNLLLVFNKIKSILNRLKKLKTEKKTKRKFKTYLDGIPYPNGIDDGEEADDEAALGPSKSCLCCIVCCSSIVVRSCSTIIGNIRIVNEVANTHMPDFDKLNKVLLRLVVFSKTEQVKSLTGSGNISVRATIRSIKVSSSNSISFKFKIDENVMLTKNLINTTSFDSICFIFF